MYTHSYRCSWAGIYAGMFTETCQRDTCKLQVHVDRSQTYVQTQALQPFLKCGGGGGGQEGRLGKKQEAPQGSLGKTVHNTQLYSLLLAKIGLGEHPDERWSLNPASLSTGSSGCSLRVLCISWNWQTPGAWKSCRGRLPEFNGPSQHTVPSLGFG